MFSQPLFIRLINRNTHFHAKNFQSTTLKKSLLISHFTRLRRLFDVLEHFKESQEEMVSKSRGRNNQEDWLLCTDERTDSKSREVYEQAKSGLLHKINPYNGPYLQKSLAIQLCQTLKEEETWGMTMLEKVRQIAHNLPFQGNCKCGECKNEPKNCKLFNHHLLKLSTERPP